MSTARLNQVLKREKRSRKFPVSKWAPEYDSFGEAVDEEDDLAFDQSALEDISRLVDEMGQAQAKKKQPKKTRPQSSNQGELF